MVRSTGLYRLTFTPGCGITEAVYSQLTWLMDSELLGPDSCNSSVHAAIGALHASYYANRAFKGLLVGTGQLCILLYNGQGSRLLGLSFSTVSLHV